MHGGEEKTRYTERSIAAFANAEPERDPRVVLDQVLEQCRMDDDWWQLRTIVEMRAWLTDAGRSQAYLDELSIEIGRARERMRSHVNAFVDEHVGRSGNEQADVPGWKR